MSLLNVLPGRLTPLSPRARRLAAAVAVLGAAGLGSVSIFATGPQPQPEPRQERSWPVSVIEVMPSRQSPTFTAYGRVESSRLARLRTDLVAQVKAVHVREGDWVAAGDVLVELADEEVRLELAEREADLAAQQADLRSVESERDRLERTLDQARSVHRVAQQKLERHQALLERRLISRSVMEAVVAEANRADMELEDHVRRLEDLPNRIAAQRARVARARALAEHARLQVEKTRVTAPFPGPVLSVQVAPGDRTGLDALLVELADARGFEVRVQVPESYAARFQRHLEQGEPVTGTLSGDANRSRPGGRSNGDAGEDGSRPGGRSYGGASPRGEDHGDSLRLVRLAQRVAPGRSGIDAFFRLPAGDAASLPAIGRVVDVRVRLPAEPGVVALPVASLYGDDRVYAVDEGRLRPVEVERVGEWQAPDGEYRVLVRSPELRAGRPIITTQLPKAVPGLLVEAS